MCQSLIMYSFTKKVLINKILSTTYNRCYVNDMVSFTPSTLTLNLKRVGSNTKRDKSKDNWGKPQTPKHEGDARVNDAKTFKHVGGSHLETSNNESISDE